MNTKFKTKSNKSVGENIRALRNEKGWSQEHVAGLLGISIPAYSKIENAVTDINLSRLEQIAALFEIDILNLFAPTDKVLQSVVVSKDSQKIIAEMDGELVNLQRKVILLYEELRGKSPEIA